LRTNPINLQSKQNMKPLQEMALIGEIVLQAKIAERAIEHLQAIVNNIDSDQVEIWSCIQSILIGTGNVSKILWPVRKEYKSRGAKLRKTLKVEEDSILSDRTIRNSFEHYDERIDDLFNEHSPIVYRDLEMNPSMSVFGHKTANNRGYNSINNTLIFRENSIDLNAVMNALKEIRHNCRHYVLP